MPSRLLKLATAAALGITAPEIREAEAAAARADGHLADLRAGSRGA